LLFGKVGSVFLATNGRYLLGPYVRRCTHPRGGESIEADTRYGEIRSLLDLPRLVSECCAA
jgi:hypothetical protein